MGFKENLKLVFLNGCSSEGQAKELVAAGISAVIGTVTSINDEVASTLAIRFYSSLGDGYQIEKAWSFAEDQINIAKGTSDTRALYWSGKQELTEKKPWVIRFKDGAIRSSQKPRCPSDNSTLWPIWGRKIKSVGCRIKTATREPS